MKPTRGLWLFLPPAQSKWSVRVFLRGLSCQNLRTNGLSKLQSRPEEQSADPRYETYSSGALVSWCWRSLSSTSPSSAPDLESTGNVARPWMPGSERTPVPRTCAKNSSRARTIPTKKTSSGGRSQRRPPVTLARGKDQRSCSASTLTMFFASFVRAASVALSSSNVACKSLAASGRSSSSAHVRKVP